jgi:hypothetical protein
MLYEKQSRNSNQDTNKWHCVKHLDFRQNEEKESTDLEFV